MKQDATIKKLAEALAQAAIRLEESACTCQDRSEGHERGCVGVDHAKPFFKIAKAHGAEVD
jgi:hypothetical protein